MHEMPDRPRQVPVWMYDSALAAVLLAQSLAEITWHQDDSAQFTAARLLGAVLTTAPLVARRWYPSMVLVVVSFGFGVTWAGTTPQPAFGESVGFLIAVYSAVVHGAGRWRTAGALLAALAAATAVALSTPGYDTGGQVISVAWILLPIAIGLVVRTYQQRAVMAEHRSEARTAEILAWERATIARELHDVVAHALTVVILHSRGGRLAAADVERPVIEAFDVIEVTSQEALHDMRRLLALLRESHDASSTAPTTVEPPVPAPSLRYLHDLTQSVARAGVDVDVDVRICGRVTDLPGGLDAVAYRFIQEGLTNVLRHAASASASVLVVTDEKTLELEVVNDGPPVGSTEPGHGLIGMRERIELFGGRFESGPRPRGGFRIHAVLPLASR